MSINTDAVWDDILYIGYMKGALGLSTQCSPSPLQSQMRCVVILTKVAKLTKTDYNEYMINHLSKSS